MKTFKTAFLCLLFPVLAFGNVKHADLSGVACQDDCDVWGSISFSVSEASPQTF